MKRTFKALVPITLIAMGLAWVSGQVASFLGFDLPPQPLVKILADPATPWLVKAKFGALAVLLAPIVEELIFRMLLHKWLLRRWLGFRAASLISGGLFALAHWHIATFIPLMFLGIAFAWLYEKEKTIRASITCHMFFNTVNFILCILFPEWVE